MYVGPIGLSVFIKKTYCGDIWAFLIWGAYYWGIILLFLGLKLDLPTSRLFS